MATPYNKVRLSGNMPGGEVWSVNPCFGRADGSAVDTFEELQAWADNIANGMPTDVIGPALTKILSPSVTLNRVRTEFYDASGALTDVAERAIVPSIRGNQIANQPYQSAVVLSLRTARPGRSFRGRLYWPAISLDLEPTNLRIKPADTLALAQDAVELLGDIAAAAENATPLQPIVVSQTLGLNTPITRVEVGDIVDNQRRRRDALTEAYATVPMVPA